ncbi:MAG: NADH-quinone oxidoreductase subunit L [Cyanobacteria bacterium]|nr:NADH-quinone oxidoreductase subunit L [Cyanobacteriota bacterium]MDA1020228.1 NADH-quinone oxidoreductase subunit L [Cyanobacteriota bacterium]
MNNIDNAWLIAIYPLVAAVAIMFVTHKSRIVSMGLSVGAVALGLVHSVIVFLNFHGHHPYEINFNWISAGDFHLELGCLIDPLAIGMLLTVNLVSLLVQIYTHGYMAEDEGYTRFYSYLSLFTFSMLGLVIATNLFQMYFFWELVGVCSFLLIGFWWHKPTAAHACKKAFVVNRVGDAGFLLGLLMLYNFTKDFWTSNQEQATLSFGKLAAATQWAIAHNELAVTGIVSVTAIGLLIFMGAAAKSAQFPLHIWLPDAMEGPTPISALIHAATMVAAGVYLLARIFPILGITGSEALPVIAWVGGITAIFAATIAFSQNDIKKALAYSTCSQLGYMVLAVGLGAPIIAMFHLITHAMFKAMLFLGSGSVIMGCHHEQDMNEMGGLRKDMPITAITFLVGTLSIAGFPMMSGFWSKDMIIAKAFEVSPALFWIATITAGMTAFYMFRIYFKTFEGKYRGHAHPHEQPLCVTGPLMVLAIPSIGLGLLGSPLMGYKLQHYFDHHFHSHMAHGQSGWEFFLHELSQPMGYLPFLMFIFGTIAAYLTYMAQTKIGDKTINEWFKTQFSIIYQGSLNKWYIDEIYNFIVAILMGFFRITFKAFERFFIEGIFVDGLAWRGTEVIGEVLKTQQSGKLQNYVLIMVSAVGLMLAWFILR